MKKIIVVFGNILLGACQTSSPAPQVVSPTSFEWRGYMIDGRCSRSLVTLQKLEGEGYVPELAQDAQQRAKLLRFLSAAESLRLNKHCWASAPPDQPQVVWNKIENKGSFGVLSAASAKIPEGVDKKDALAVDLFRDMLLRGYSREEAGSVVGTSLWNEHLAWRHFSRK